MTTRLQPAGLPFRAALVVVALVAPAAARAQTTSALLLDPWTHAGFGETLDRPHYQAQADVRDSGATTQLFFWDSTGRFRLAPSTAADPRVGYRYLTINTDSDSPTLPDTLDEVSLAFGVRLGEAAGGQVSIVVGAGYGGDNLFADANGLFGTGHLLYERRLSDRDALVLSLDYDGSRAFLPDVPLPGFAYAHDGEALDWSVGFPQSRVSWEVAPRMTLSAAYAVPYTGDATLAYALTDQFSVFGGYASFLNAFALDGEGREDRFFLRMQRVEFGVRYVNPDVLGRGLYVDVALTVGYVFEQAWSRGFDVRDLDPVASTEGTPYVGIVLGGRF
ncbi:MAG: hypothetical protein JWO31_3857 [Phycisphaerales bacterium]|nr:hypothetical protein [Phycisphaerales bacterium]